MDESELQQSLELYRAQVTGERYTGLVVELSFFVCFFFKPLDCCTLTSVSGKRTGAADAEPVLPYS